MRVLNGVMLVLFLLSMAVQYNDPDGWLWMIYYGVAAVLTGLAIVGRYTWVSFVAMAGFLAGAAMSTPGWGWDTVMLLREPKMSSHDVELAREAFGLLICAVWMGVLGIAWSRSRGPKPVAKAGSAHESID